MNTNDNLAPLVLNLQSYMSILRSRPALSGPNSPASLSGTLLAYYSSAQSVARKVEELTPVSSVRRRHPHDSLPAV